MKYILDTHILLWFLSHEPRLKPKYRKEIESLSNDCFVSAASLWEISIKYSLNKLKLGFELDRLFELVTKSGFEILEIKKAHLIGLAKLPFHHRDPFDRLIIAQTMEENATLITVDDQMKLYSINLL